MNIAKTTMEVRRSDADKLKQLADKYGTYDWELVNILLLEWGEELEKWLKG